MLRRFELECETLVKLQNNLYLESLIVNAFWNFFVTIRFIYITTVQMQGEKAAKLKKFSD